MDQPLESTAAGAYAAVIGVAAASMRDREQLADDADACLAYVNLGFMTHAFLLSPSSGQQ